MGSQSMKIATAILTSLAIVTLVPSGVNAADCNTYALNYPAGLKLVNTPKGPKFLATAAVEVDIDDPGEVLDAKSEATMEAKALIAKFFNEDVKSEKNVNTLIFPNLDSANITYKLMKELNGTLSIGPILMGLNAPVHILQLGASVQEIVNMAAMAVVDAQQKRK